MVMIFAVIGMGYILLSLLLSTGNQLGGFFGYLLGGALILGIGQPKAAVILLLIVSGYIDWGKRLLVVADRVTYTDLAFVLGIAPALMAGITISTFFKGVQGSVPMGKNQFKAIGVILATLALSLVVAIKQSGGVMAGLQEVANTAGYSCFLFVIPLLYAKVEDQVKLMKWALISYLPIPIYGVYQAAFGLAEYEIEYLKTGMSILIKQLMTGEIRPFSTLNSPTALGAICGIMALLSFLSGPLTAKNRKFPHPLFIILGLIYLAGLVASTSRSDLFIILSGGVMTVTVLNPLLVRLFYVVAFIGYITLILIAGWLQERLADIEGFIFSLFPADLQIVEQLTRIQTFSDRLEGFRHLAGNRQVWSLFGVSEEIRLSILCHDPLTHSILRFGIVPTGAALVILVWILIRTHKGLNAIKDKRERWLAALAMGTAGGVVVTSLLSGSRTSIFPVTVFLWLMISMVWSRISYSGDTKNKSPSAAPKKQAGPPQPRLQHHRFKPASNLGQMHSESLLRQHQRAE